MLRALAANLRARRYEVDVAPTSEAALDLAGRHPPDVVVLDLGLPGIGGLEVIERLRGWLVTSEEVVTEVWGPANEDRGHLRTHLAHIRKKLEPEGGRPRYFLTEGARGYRFEPGAASFPPARDTGSANQFTDVEPEPQPEVAAGDPGHGG
jgi:DNA-binding response OmpR family regulator